MGADVVIATPGRLITHISLGNVDLSKVSFFILDEADRMLDMGFSEDINTIAAKLPDPATHAEKAARMDRLLKTQEEFAFAATAAMAGRTVRVLVEAAGRNEGTVNGRLDNNLVVEFKAPESLIGQWADVHITGSRAALLVGELAE